MLRRALLLILLNLVAASHGKHHAGHHASLSAQELDEIRQQIIRSLGLTRQPDMSKINVTEEEKEEAYEIYLQRLKEKQNEDKIEENDDDSQELESFPVTVESDRKGVFPIQLRIPVEKRADIPKAALLRVFKTMDEDEEENSSGRRWSPRVSPLIVTLYVYETFTNDTSRRLVATQTMVVKENEWEAVDVSPIVYSWSNLSDVVTLEVDCDGCDFHKVRISLEDPSRRPALDLFWTSGRSKRSAGRQGNGKKKKQKSATSSLESYKRTSSPSDTDCTKANRKKCCRHPLFVNFAQLGLDFMVEPKGFEAFYCKGKCPKLYNPAHTHALIQSTLHAQRLAPKPCCAPSKLTNLTVIHYDENGKLVVTDWSNAVVTECACS